MIVQKENFSFPVSVYGEMTPYNEVSSKARVRIFYKGANRNGTYITDEFADLLSSSLPYTPVKGIYDNTEEDYTDHGPSRSLGRIYGVVPENPNCSWEEHLDDDGVTRTYLCADVLIFTALYKEGTEIVGKSQSMEIYPPSIEGEWQIINGKKYYVYTKGCFLGLQVLGDEIEPCFEGAEFFSLYKKTLDDLIYSYESYTKKKSQSGGKKMSIVNYKISDREKHDAIWSLLNKNYDEEHDWEVNYSICDIYDDYALVYDYENNSYLRAYYSKDEENDAISIKETSVCYIVDVTEDEKKALTAVQALNGGNYSNLDSNFVAKDEVENQKAVYEEKISDMEQKKAESEATIATLTTERDNALNDKENLEAEKSSLEEEVATLSALKNEVERKQKEEAIQAYSNKMDKKAFVDFEKKYSEMADNFSLVDLQKEMALEFVTSFNLLENDDTQPRVPNNAPKTGIEGILSKYSK